MTIQAASRTSLADVIALISNAALSKRQKRSLRSAVRTVARILDADPAAIPADTALLRRRLEKVAPRGAWPVARPLG